MKALLATLLLAASVGAQAQAKLQPAQSDLSFQAHQMGVPVDGHFKHFDAQLAFDPAKLAAAQVSFTVDMNSGTIGSPEYDAELVKAAWFNAGKLPQAVFKSTAFKPAGAGRYEVAGTLTIKGQSKPVVVPVTLSKSGATTVATGSLAIKRLDFKIGEGEWTDTSVVADDVTVKFKLAFTGL